MKQLYIILLAGYFMFSGCVKTPTEADQLTDTTHLGNGSLSCLKNGVVWLPHFGTQTLGFPARYSNLATGALNYRNLHHEFSGIVFNAEKDGYGGDPLALNEGMFFSLTGYSVGQYSLKDSSAKITFWWGGHPDAQRVITGNVSITFLDTTKKIISGIFDFKALDAQGIDTVVFSEGRFDLPLIRQ